MLPSIRVTKSPLLCLQKQYVVLLEAFVVCNIGVEYIAVKFRAIRHCSPTKSLFISDWFIVIINSNSDSVT